MLTGFVHFVNFAAEFNFVILSVYFVSFVVKKNLTTKDTKDTQRFTKEHLN